MMPLHLTERDVARSLTMPEAVAALDDAFGLQNEGGIMRNLAQGQ
jgi:hypothetical protein